MNEARWWCGFMVAVMFCFTFGMSATECTRQRANVQIACIHKTGNPVCRQTEGVKP